MAKQKSWPETEDGKRERERVSSSSVILADYGLSLWG